MCTRLVLRHRQPNPNPRVCPQAQAANEAAQAAAAEGAAEAEGAAAEGAAAEGKGVR